MNPDLNPFTGIPNSPFWSNFFSTVPIVFLIITLLLYLLAQQQRTQLREKETIIDYLQGMIDSGQKVCYVCGHKRLHANHKDSILQEGRFDPAVTGVYSTAAASLTEEELMELTFKMPTTDQHHYFDGRLIPYRFNLDGEPIPYEEAR